MQKPFIHFVEAGIDILWIISNVDHEFHDLELQVIELFLKDYRGEAGITQSLIEEEIGYLESLPVPHRMERFFLAAEYLQTHASPEVLQMILEFTYYAIVADGKILESERDLFKILFEKWKMNSENILHDKI